MEAKIRSKFSFQFKASWPADCPALRWMAGEDILQLNLKGIIQIRITLKNNSLIGEMMFKITQKGVNRLDIEMSGKLNSEDMKVALDELVLKSENIVNGKMLYDVTDYHLPSLGAIAIEFSRLPSMFRWVKKFERAAVLADKTWLKKISELEGALIPGMEIKAFNRNQKAEAEAWLSS